MSASELEVELDKRIRETQVKLDSIEAKLEQQEPQPLESSATSMVRPIKSQPTYRMSRILRN